MTTVRILAVVIAASLLGSSLAAAETEEPETLIRQGIELRRKGDDARAHGYFKRAYELSKTPRAAAQLGLVDQALGRWLEAEILIVQAVASNDPWVQQHRSTLDDGLKVVRQHLGGVVVGDAPAGTTWSDADHAAGPLPAGGAIWVSPGESTLRFEAPGQTALTKTVKVAAGESVSVKVDFAPQGGAAGGTATGDANAPGGSEPSGGSVSQPASQPAADQNVGRAGRIAGIAVAGAGVALGVGGFLFRTVATNKLDAINNAAASGMPYDKANDNWQTFDRVGVAMLIAGGAAIVGGAVLYIVNMHKAPEAPATQVGFVAVPDPRGGGTLQLHARF
jgi:hypothetical protein